MSGDKGSGRDLIGRKCGTAVEAEPAEPEQRSTQHGHRQTVRHEIGSAKTLSWTDDKYAGQRRHTTGCMDHQTAGKIHHTNPAEPAAAAPDPVADRVVDKHRP